MSGSDPLSLDLLNFVKVRSTSSWFARPADNRRFHRLEPGSLRLKPRRTPGDSQGSDRNAARGTRVEMRASRLHDLSPWFLLSVLSPNAIYCV